MVERQTVCRLEREVWREAPSTKREHRDRMDEAHPVRLLVLLEAVERGGLLVGLKQVIVLAQM